MKTSIENIASNLTPLETIVLTSISKGDEYEYMPTECIQNIKEDTALDTKVLRGVLSSLIQKGYIQQGEYPNGMTAFHFALK